MTVPGPARARLASEHGCPVVEKRSAADRRGAARREQRLPGVRPRTTTRGTRVSAARWNDDTNDDVDNETETLVDPSEAGAIETISADIEVPPEKTFADYGVEAPIVEALDRAGITHPFPIQAMTLPVALSGHDIIGQAKTGTGKTLGFGIPLIQRTVGPGEEAFDPPPEPGKPQALVVVPTRELAVQVAGDLDHASSLRSVRVLTVYGGRAYEPQVEALKRGVEIVVGTPGRLLDLAQQGHLSLANARCVVLDEADEMLDLGFLPEGAREQALRAFRNGKVDVLVATDVAARGIDVTDVTHVVNYQCTEDDKTYVHRIGRTGRAGKKGTAVTFVDWDDMPRWGLINKQLAVGIPEPVETYSTSPHLFKDLGIPEGTKGVLPRKDRTRAGLDAEEVEDLGETGAKARGAGASGPGRSRDGGGREREREARPPRTRNRRRTRGGQPVEAGQPSSGQPSSSQPSQPTGSDGDAPRRRRRRRGGRGGSGSSSD